MRTLAEEIADSGGIDAPISGAARLRELLGEELAHGVRELARNRAGYERPVAVVFAGLDGLLIAALPVDPAYRADVAKADERERSICAAAVGALVRAAGDRSVPATAGQLRLGAAGHGHALCLSYPLSPAGPDAPARAAAEAFPAELGRIDRLRITAIAAPGHVVADIGPWATAIGTPHPLQVAEVVARLGGRPVEGAADEGLEEAVGAILAPAPRPTPAHADPDPARRVARRIVQRLAGMGKWRGYHTAFEHLSRGFAGNERALASNVGERLVDAGLLGQKQSVGQRHVFLNPARAGEIYALIERGEVPADLDLPKA